MCTYYLNTFTGLYLPFFLWLVGVCVRVWVCVLVWVCACALRRMATYVVNVHRVDLPVLFFFVGSKMDHVSIEFNEGAHLRGS